MARLHEIEINKIINGKTILTLPFRKDGDNWATVRCQCGREFDSRIRGIGRNPTCSKCWGKVHSGLRAINWIDGRSKHPLITTYMAMIRRCTDIEDPAWANYGGRGISVCVEWSNDFWIFVRDMGHRPKGLSLDRINNDGPYEPDNCRWATRAEQTSNKRSPLTIPAIQTRQMPKGTFTQPGYMMTRDIAQKYGVTLSGVNKWLASGILPPHDLKRGKYRFWLPKTLEGWIPQDRRKTRCQYSDVNTHCKLGHEYAVHGLYVDKHGYRYCKRCSSDKSNERQKAKRRESQN